MFQSVISMDVKRQSNNPLSKGIPVLISFNRTWYWKGHIKNHTENCRFLVRTKQNTDRPTFTWDKPLQHQLIFTDNASTTAVQRQHDWARLTQQILCLLFGRHQWLHLLSVLLAGTILPVLSDNNSASTRMSTSQCHSSVLRWLVTKLLRLKSVYNQ